MDERERRIGENEVLYREVNERVRGLNSEFGLAEEQAQFVCECGRIDCSAPIHLSGAEYEHVRSDPATFAVKPGHEILDTESVVEEHEGYLVVRKHEDGPAQLARETDPR